VNRAERFLLTTHVRPDADGLGSMLALAEVLEQTGKQVRMVISSTWPPRYNFLDPGRRIQRLGLPGDEYRQTDAVIILDTGTWSQLGDFGTLLKTLTVPRLVIDHHISQEDLGAVRLVDVAAEATGRLVYEAIAALREPLTARVASLLFAALATDTGWFRHKNTTPASLALAAQLVEAGAQPTVVYDHLYENNTLPRLKLTALVLNRLLLVENGKVAFSEIRREDYAATGAVPQDSEDLVNYTRSIAGVEVGLLFMEQPAGGVKVSFRSRERVDVARLAEKFAGGGHRLAAGATVQGPLDTVKGAVLDAVHSALSS
jgi:phosphoesterase RecJ-like protein